jgi:hypothetical protein
LIYDLNGHQYSRQPMKHVTIGFSIHRPELIGIMADLMHRHDVIFLEEPPANDLEKMLQGDLSIADYLFRVKKIPRESPLRQLFP